jgi:hypothetical protein
MNYLQIVILLILFYIYNNFVKLAKKIKNLKTKINNNNDNKNNDISNYNPNSDSGNYSLNNSNRTNSLSSDTLSNIKSYIDEHDNYDDGHHDKYHVNRENIFQCHDNMHNNNNIDKELLSDSLTKESKNGQKIHTSKVKYIEKINMDNIDNIDNIEETNNDAKLKLSLGALGSPKSAKSVLGLKIMNSPKKAEVSPYITMVKNKK